MSSESGLTEYREERERLRESSERRERADAERERIANEARAERRAFQVRIEAAEEALHQARLLLSHNNVVYAYGPKET